MGRNSQKSTFDVLETPLGERLNQALRSHCRCAPQHGSRDAARTLRATPRTFVAPEIATVSGTAPGRLVRLIYKQPHVPPLVTCDTARRGRVAIGPRVGYVGELR